jgi:putative hemolysin
MPNPASTYCASKAGATQMLTGPDGGQTGFCSFGGPDSAIEEWTLFRTSPPPAGTVGLPAPQAAVAAFTKGGLLGATVNTICGTLGAAAVSYTCSAPGCALGAPSLTVCAFPDGSMMSAQALMAGPAGAPGLAAALK